MENSLKQFNSRKLNNYNILTWNLLRPTARRIDTGNKIYNETILITIFPVNQNFKSRV